MFSKHKDRRLQIPRSEFSYATQISCFYHNLGELSIDLNKRKMKHLSKYSHWGL